MIVKMNKTTLICLKHDQQHTLERLRELGVMHVELTQKAAVSDEQSQVAQYVDRLERAIGFLESRTVKHKHAEDSVDIEEGKRIAEELLSEIDINDQLKKDIEALQRDRDRFLPWGNFSGNLVKELEDSGIFVYLCSGLSSDLEALPEHASYKVLHEEKGKCHYAVISKEELDSTTLPIVSLPQDSSLQQIENALVDCNTKFEASEQKLDEFVLKEPVIKAYLDSAREKQEFLVNRDGMEAQDELSYIQGYVPVDRFSSIQEAAKEYGWALCHDPASIEDPKVPTLLKIPKAFRIIEPLMGFLGISPGYDEVDVSVCFLFFLTIFFGMILGDAGYGLTFLTISLIAKFSMKNKALQKPVNLFITFSISTFIWGALNGNYFGIDNKVWPTFMQGLDCFTIPEVRDKNIQLFCFILAVAHLSTGRLWQAILRWNAPRQALGEIGWAVILWGNFFVTIRLLVFPGPIEKFVLVIYGVGLVLVVLCGVNWLDLGEAFNFPFGLIGAFVDMLSYIRLYAVGMSGFYIANSFNSMGMNVFTVSDSVAMMPVLIIGGVIVILFGHLLNIALCMMGVLVHGVRLNTLEFSNHMGLRWAGMQYKPFSKIATDSVDNE